MPDAPRSIFGFPFDLCIADCNFALFSGLLDELPLIFMNFSLIFLGVTRLKVCCDKECRLCDRPFTGYTDLIRLDSLIDYDYFQLVQFINLIGLFKIVLIGLCKIIICTVI